MQTELDPAELLNIFRTRPAVTVAKPRKYKPRPAPHPEWVVHARTFREAGDENFCVPMTLAFVLDLDPVKVDASLKAAGVRRTGKGVHRHHWLTWLADHGVHQQIVSPEPYQKRARTAITAARVHPEGRFVLEFKAHVAALIDGEVKDWINGRRHALWFVRKLTVQRPERIARLR